MGRDLPSFSFGGMHPELGKRTGKGVGEIVKTTVPKDMYADVKLLVRQMGYEKIGEWLYDVLIREVYGEERLRSLYKEKYERVQRLTNSAGTPSETFVPPGGSR